MAKNKLLARRKKAATEKMLTAARARAKKLRADEEALEQQLEAVEDEIPDDLEQQLDTIEQQQAETAKEIQDLLDDLEKLNNTLEEVDENIGEGPAGEGEEERRRSSNPAQRTTYSAGFRSRSRCFASRSQRDAFYAQPDIKNFLGDVRTRLTAAAASKRSVNGADLTIPQVMLDILRDNLHQYSKLVSKVRLRNVSGTARQQLVGKIPEGVWTEMCAKLNELAFSITEIETDGYKVGGYIAICNWLLKDSDVNLGEEILYMLGQAIGLALDKAIVYGLGAPKKMPLGIVTRLAQTEKPDNWGMNRGEWTNLHSSHILQLDLANKTGVEFFVPFLAALAKAKPTYVADGKFWVMNEATRQDILIRSLAYNSAAAITSGMDNTMPIIGGEIITLEFIPDYNIVGGYPEYLLAEREGATFGSSDQVFYLEDKTVFKGVARYDGQPIDGEAFTLIAYNNTAPVTVMDFAPDIANTAPNALVVTSSQYGGESGETVLTVAGAINAANDLYAIVGPATVSAGQRPNNQWTPIKSGVTPIKAKSGSGATVVECNADGIIISIGYVPNVQASA